MSKKKTEQEPLPMSYWYTYLARHGIPKHTVQMLQIALIQDALTQSGNMKCDRIYTGIGLMLCEVFGFGRERIMRGLHGFDDICGSVLSDNPENEQDWVDIMQRFKDKTGIVIHTGGDDRLIAEISRD